MLGGSFESADEASSAVARRPADIADALFREAADSDDVTDTQSAIEYFDGRLAILGDLIPADVAGTIRETFRERLRAWDHI